MIYQLKDTAGVLQGLFDEDSDSSANGTNDSDDSDTAVIFAFFLGSYLR